MKNGLTEYFRFANTGWYIYQIVLLQLPWATAGKVMAIHEVINARNTSHK